MVSKDDFKFKGAATEEPQMSTVAQPEAREDGELDPEPELDPAAESATHKTTATAAAAATNTEQVPQSEVTQAAAIEKHRWYKIHDQGYIYFMHCDTQQSMYTEPAEPYWNWDPVSQGPDLVLGLQIPFGEGASTGAAEYAVTAAAASATGLSEEYKGYNPKIHGSYDPKADYAKWHDDQREKEQAVEQARLGVNPNEQQNPPVVSGAFNARTGRFQTGEQSAERHNDYNKSSRQMEAFGNNIDAAANSHGGVSLKEQRRNQKVSKKQLETLREKKKSKQKKKAMAFYTS